MKVKQIKNELILTWEKTDSIKPGETITVDLSKPTKKQVMDWLDEKIMQEAHQN